MKLLTELLASVKRIDTEDDERPDPEFDDVEGLDDPEGEAEGDMEGVPSDMEDPDGDAYADAAEELDAQQDGAEIEQDLEQDGDLDQPVDDVLQDPNREGLIRAVPNAHLVYKRSAEDGTYTELWLYKITNMQEQVKIKRAILSGTDIPVNKMESPDGQQIASIWSAGNIEMLEISGLPS